MTLKRTDSNQKVITDCFRRLGYSIIDLSGIGGGCPDIEIGKHGINDLVEIKTENGKLNELQLAFAAKWNAPVYLIRSVDDIVDFDAGNKIKFQIK
jgi:hypothetical protein